MRRTNSKLANGTSISPQLIIEQETIKKLAEQIKAKLQLEQEKKKEAEEKAKREHYLRYELVKSSPLKIPKNAQIDDQIKTGYEQVKYRWKKGKFKYTLRWHTRTPDAPPEQGTTWVVERRRMGDSRTQHIDYILIGKKGKKNIWVFKNVWEDAIKARKVGTATKEQEELLKNGHWKV